MVKNCYQRLLDKDCTDAEAFLNCGLELLQSRQFEAAVKSFKGALELHPNNAAAYFYVGFSNMSLGKLKLAIANFDKTIELDPNHAITHNHRGLAKLSLGRYEEAIADFDIAIKLDSKNSDVYNNRGNVKQKLGRIEEAITDFDTAIDHNSKNSNAYNNRGSAKQQLGKIEEAIADYNTAIDLDPNFPSPYYNRGRTKSSLGRIKEAIADFDIALQLDPYFADPYNNRGIEKGKLGLKEEAIADFNKTIELDTKHPSGYYNRGIEYSKLGKVSIASLDFYCVADLIKNNFSDFPTTDILNHFHHKDPAPFQVQHIIASKPNLQSSLSYQQLITENEKQCQSLNLWLAWLDIKYPSPNRDVEWLRAWIYFHAGDPVSAFYILDALDDGSEKDFAQEYYFLLSAEAIQHEEKEEIRAFAKKSALRFSKNQEDDDMQIYWAARLLMHCGEPLAALDCLQKGLGGEMYFYHCRSEAFELAGYSGELSIELAKEPPAITGVEATENIKTTELKPNDTLKDFLWKMELAAQYYDLEPKINAVFADGSIKPRLWEIWDTSALEVPIREHRMDVLDAKLKADFNKALREALESKVPNTDIFKSETRTKTWDAYKSIKGSDDLVYEISQMIFHAKYSKEIIADLIEYFYLDEKLPETEVFYLYFHLTVCKKSKVPNEALGEGSQEAGKVIIEDIINKLIEYGAVGGITSSIGYLSGPFAAGAGLGLVILARAFLKQDFSLSNKPYSEFKAEFKTFIFKQYEAMGEEQFYKNYPMRGFDDFKSGTRS